MPTVSNVTAASGILNPASSLRVDVVDALDSLRESWMRLAASSGNVFAAWEWNELWWRHYGRGRELRVAVSQREDDQIDAIVPLFVWSRRPLRILRLIGHGHGDRLGPICRHNEIKAAEQGLRRALDADPHDLFIADWVAGDRDWASVLGARTVRRTGYPILRLPDGSWDAFLAAQSQRFRKNARNSRNRLEREHDVSYRYADSATIERDLDAALHLHRGRFREHAGCLFCGDHEPFQREFAALALERGWLRLLMLEIDGAPAAFEYGFLFQNAYFAYQSGRDPAWDRYSVGFLVEFESIRRAFGDGVAEYRFLGGEEGYKYRFTTEDPRLETIAAPATRRGRVAARAVAAVLALPAGKAVLRRIASAKSAKASPTL
jgi:CelD/BcsL family acetyltransferase involved in cellulose biosynthesis